MQTVSQCEVADTVIFVDVDGVLNVSIQDEPQPDILLNASNVKAVAAVENRASMDEADLSSIERLESVFLQKASDRLGSETYGDLACTGTRQVSEVLVKRLAELISSAGPDRSVVLSSNWRRERCRAQVRDLESQLSAYLGRPFAFDATTKQAEETNASHRLQCIGDYIHDLCAGRTDCDPLKVLVLDDFFCSPLNGWLCGGRSMRSAGVVEEYLRDCAPDKDVELSVKFVHTYDEWRTLSGMRVQVGSGLTQALHQEACEFLASFVATSTDARHSSPALSDVGSSDCHWEDLDSLWDEAEDGSHSAMLAARVQWTKMHQGVRRKISQVAADGLSWISTCPLRFKVRDSHRIDIDCSCAMN